MRQLPLPSSRVHIACLLAALAAFPGCAAPAGPGGNAAAGNDCVRPIPMPPGVGAMAGKDAPEHLEHFDDLDFNVFSNQRWDRLHLSHSKFVVVHWPDGRRTAGIDAHVRDLKQMFVYAPDTRIGEHPIRIAAGDWTAVTGVMNGTFTRPMPAPDGRTLQPTGRSFSLEMVTIGHWIDGVMDEEWLYWDNAAFMKQIGLAN